MKAQARDFFSNLQTRFCDALERADGKARFQSDVWQREDMGGGHGGGGTSRILRNGAIFEQAGINFSEVQGILPKEMSEKLTGKSAELPFYATGTSLVFHPISPLIPTTHANFRYLEVGDLSWFGGGSDLTPYYLFDEDAQHFHRVLKAACDRHDVSFYPRFKKECDQYFYLPHRKETRGVGGIFFDYLAKGDAAALPMTYSFVQTVAPEFLLAYLPIVERRRHERWTEQQKYFQLVRRGRYVEFNLLYDRGTLFGLKTGGRTESILMSLPPEVRWEYNLQVQNGSPEARLIEVLQNPREWVENE